MTSRSGLIFLVGRKVCRWYFWHRRWAWVGCCEYSTRGSTSSWVEAGGPQDLNNNNNDDDNDYPSNNHNDVCEFTDETTFRVNDNFVCASKRFKVRVVLYERKAKEEQATTDTEERLKKERELVVDALIVRIMKSRRKLHHNVLVQEVVSQSAARFVPPLSVIKTRIQILIEREFIARCPDDMNSYVYIE